MSLNPAEFRKAMGCFATGVTIITVDLDRQDLDRQDLDRQDLDRQDLDRQDLDRQVHGMTANAFASVSLDPPLVLVCVDRQASTHAHLHSRKRFGVNVLSQDQRAISEYYARADRRDIDAETVAGARFDHTQHGTPVLHGSLAYLECRLRSAEEAGDHTIFIAEVEDVVVREGDPLLFHKGKYRKIGKDVGS